MEVPERTLVPPSSQMEVMLKPAAQMLTGSP